MFKNQRGEAGFAIVAAIIFIMMAFGVDIDNKARAKKEAAAISNTVGQSK